MVIVDCSGRAGHGRRAAARPRRAREEAFHAVIHVRGNEIAIRSGTPPRPTRVARLFEELVLLLDRGQAIDKGMVARPSA
jgi:hypothetical protein